MADLDTASVPQVLYGARRQREPNVKHLPKRMISGRVQLDRKAECLVILGGYPSDLTASAKVLLTLPTTP